MLFTKVKSYRIILIGLGIIIISSCQESSRSNSKKIAHVGKDYLYLSDINDDMPMGISEEDSISLVKSYIDNWVKQKIYLAQASQFLTEDDREQTEKKVEDYRNSLLIFQYESNFIAQNLDTIITNEVLQEYYQEHQNEFKLRDHIVQANFIKLPVDAPDVNMVRRLIRSEDDQDLSELEDYCINHAAGYFLMKESWYIFSDILREIPVNPSNIPSYLKSNNFIEVRDQYYRYFLFIKDFRLEGSVSPLNFQSDNIRAIILNHRKQTLINNHRQELYLEAIKNNSIEIL